MINLDKAEPSPYQPPNPYQGLDGSWRWYDEVGDDSRPYASEEEAALGLKKYLRYLETGEIE